MLQVHCDVMLQQFVVKNKTRCYVNPCPFIGHERRRKNTSTESERHNAIVFVYFSGSRETAVTEKRRV